MPISIIIPSYNRAQLIKGTLKSIILQSSSEWECIVVDDFSTDDTKDIVLELGKQDKRISYYLNSHKKGAQGARNTGLDHAKFDWVLFFDSDNKMHQDFVETMLFTLDKSKEADVIACCSDIIDVDKGITGRIMNPRCNGNIHNNLFLGKSYVDFNQAIIRKKMLSEIGGLDEDCPSMQEWDTHIRLSKKAQYCMIDRRLIDYYIGGNDAISSNKKREVIGRLYILKKHLQEWKSRQRAFSIFSYQIYCLIKQNEDSHFKTEKLCELRNLVPFLYVRVFLCEIWSDILKMKS